MANQIIKPVSPVNRTSSNVQKKKVVKKKNNSADNKPVDKDSYSKNGSIDTYA